MDFEDRINLDGRQPVVLDDDRINSTGYEEWVKEGLSLQRDYSGYKWNLGDWWNKGHKYGERKKLVESEEWDGPSFSTCASTGAVCKEFTSCRRRQVLSFGHHMEVQSLPAEEQDKLLDECEAEGHSLMKLRQRVKEVKSFLAQGWTQSQMDRRRKIEKGGVALANLSKGDDGEPIDSALLYWAEAEGRDDEDFSVCDKDHALDFENKEYYAHVKSVLSKTLSETELCVIKMRYYADMTQDEVGDVLGVHQSWVSRHENTALRKLGSELM